MSRDPGWLHDLFALLPAPPSEAGVYFTKPIGEGAQARLGLGANGLALLLPVAHSAVPQADLRLANLSVVQRARCRIIDHDIDSTNEFAIVECTSTDPRVREVFLDVAEWLLPVDGIEGVDGVRQLIASLTQLFRLSESPPRTSTIGLWGELWLIASSDDPTPLAAAWHSEPNGRWDFSGTGWRLEAKTTTGGRSHHFAYEQLRAPSDVRVVVASIVTTDSSSGPCIADLLDDISRRITDSVSRSKVVSVAMASLGTGWPTGCRARYDDELAATSVRFLDAVNVPTIHAPPTEISRVQFEVDVEDVEVITTESVVESALEAVLSPWVH
jgi:hypothetical protein